MISFDQLRILDNVISESIVRMIMHQEYKDVPLHIGTVPCETTEDDILASLIQLLQLMGMYILFTCIYVLIVAYIAALATNAQYTYLLNSGVL